VYTGYEIDGGKGFGDGEIEIGKGWRSTLLWRHN
jgi:hypothetical protein